MNIKKILFAVMCTLIVLTVVMAGIVVGRVVNMFQGLLSAPPPTEPTQETTAPTEPTTLPPTEEPTEPPTTLPTEPGHEHAYTKKQKVVEPNCINMGYTIYKCECGDTDIDDFIDPLGHEYGEGEEITFCEKNGYTQYKCIRCTDVQKKGKLAPVGHKYTVEKERVDATCQATGYVVMGCSGIGCTLEERKELPIAGHDFSKEIEKVTSCTQTGYVIHQCAFDGCTERKKTDLPATGHNFGSWNGDENTCQNGCGTTLQASDMKVTTQDCTGTESKHYYIEVGTDAVPKVYSYVVEDHRQNAAAPTFAYVHGQGLAVTYTDSTGSHTEYLDDGEMLDISADEDT